MTVREINATVRSGKHVIALYETAEGQGYTGRVRRARTRQGIIEVQALATGHWGRMVDVWVAR